MLENVFNPFRNKSSSVTSHNAPRFNEVTIISNKKDENHSLLITCVVSHVFYLFCNVMDGVVEPADSQIDTQTGVHFQVHP